MTWKRSCYSLNMPRLAWVTLVALLTTGNHRSVLTAEEGPRLPVRRVVLYKNGVGYFEHLGRVQGKQDVTISFTSGQLNDVLKSLTVLDLNGGKVTGVSYGSSAPVDKQLESLRLGSADAATISGFLGALRGARIEVRSGVNVIAGRLLSVERKTRISGGSTLEIDYLSLITDTGELRTTELSPQFSVRLLEKGLPGKVDRLLDLAALSREPDVRQMIVSTDGTGERSMLVSYISEVPVWKATYRLVLDAKRAAPLLQGWAIVDNTVGQDWENVQLSLIAGAPQSFVQNLSQPFYTRRPVIGLPQSVNSTPQTYQATLTTGSGKLQGTVRDASGSGVAGAYIKLFDASGSLIGQTTASASGSYELASLPNGVGRLEVMAPGFQVSNVANVQLNGLAATSQDVVLMIGGLSESVTVQAAPSNVDTAAAEYSRRGGGSGAMLGRGSGIGGSRGGRGASEGLGEGIGSGSGGGAEEAPRFKSPAAIVPANLAGQQLGDLFEYKLKDPITIRKNRSALVPIVQSEVAAEKVSVWSERMGRPQRALWLTNSSGSTLDGGSFSVLEEETFAGEGVFEPIRQDEKRIISYAVDLALNASSTFGNSAEPVRRVRIFKGAISHHSEQRERKTYTIRNEDTKPRMLIVEHPFRRGYELRGDSKPAETTASTMRFRVPIEPKKTATLVVDEVRPIESTYAISNVDSSTVAAWLQARTINAAVERELQRVIAQKLVISNLEEEKEAREQELQKIYDDQERLRENLKALKGSAEEKALVQRYTQQLDKQENQLETLRVKVADLERQVTAEQSSLDRMIAAIDLDVTL